MLSIKSKIKNRVNTLINNLTEDFSVNKLSKSPSRFDFQKLNWFNRQYISMMNLEEFAYRSCLNKISLKSTNKKLRVGDYIYFVDLEKQKTLVMINGQNAFIDNKYHQMGGGRKEGESSIAALQREVSEESQNRINLNTQNLIEFVNFEIIFDSPLSLENPETEKPELYDGKVHNVYLYELKIEEIQDFTNNENENYAWVNLAEVISSNKYITYSIWKEFCNNHNFECFEPNERTLQQYLAYILDKNRITVLSEFGTESDTVLNWRSPEIVDLKWKKDTLEQSLKNLKEISGFILKQTDLFVYYNTNVAKAYKENTLETYLSLETSKWETRLKTWITENNKDAGSYFWPLRVILSGKTKSPSPFELLAILTKDEIKERLESIEI